MACSRDGWLDWFRLEFLSLRLKYVLLVCRTRMSSVKGKSFVGAYLRD